MATYGRPVATVTDRLEPPFRLADDLAPLRERYAGLLDRMASEIYNLGLDLDDCVVERSMRLRVAGVTGERHVSAENLGSVADVLKQLSDNELGDSLGRTTPADLIATAITLHAFRVPDYPDQTCSNR